MGSLPKSWKTEKMLGSFPKSASQTRRRTWTVAFFDLYIHIDSSIDFSIESIRCVDMSVHRLPGFFSDDRQTLSKSLPEVTQKLQKSDQNRHRFTSYSKLHYVASSLAMCCHFRLVFKMWEATSKKIPKIQAHMVHSQSAHGAREKRPVVLELGQLEGRLQSPRLTGAGEPTVGRARAKYPAQKIAPFLHA